jgi:hypothetical protein
VRAIVWQRYKGLLRVGIPDDLLVAEYRVRIAREERLKHRARTRYQ